MSLNYDTVSENRLSDRLFGSNEANVMCEDLHPRGCLLFDEMYRASEGDLGLLGINYIYLTLRTSVHIETGGRIDLKRRSYY